MTPPAASRPEPDETEALPSLQTLVEQIPADVRTTLDELFRARFVAVKKIPKAALKEQSVAS